MTDTMTKVKNNFNAAQAESTQLGEDVMRGGIDALKKGAKAITNTVSGTAEHVERRGIIGTGEDIYNKSHEAGEGVVKETNWRGLIGGGLGVLGAWLASTIFMPSGFLGGIGSTVAFLAMALGGFFMGHQMMSKRDDGQKTQLAEGPAQEPHKDKATALAQQRERASDGARGPMDQGLYDANVEAQARAARPRDTSYARDDDRPYYTPPHSGRIVQHR